jgi:two-component system nitrate/nitrite response regulator NarL
MEPSNLGSALKAERELLERGHGNSQLPRVVVVSPIRIYREILANALTQYGSIGVVATVAHISELGPILTDAAVDVVLFDLAVEGGLTALRWLAHFFGLKVVALGLSDEEAHIIACARAGIAGYVTPDDTLNELVRRVHDATAGEFNCSPRVAATLLRSLAASTISDGSLTITGRLTPRESEIVQLIARGLSNKQIAGHLTIQVATVKNHVHNILEKLGVQRRADAVRVAHAIEILPPEQH